MGINPTVENVSNNKQQITITKNLLNPSDHFTIKILATKLEKVCVYGRIVGVQHIREINSLKPTLYVSILLCTIYNITGLLFVFLPLLSLYRDLEKNKISTNISDAIEVEIMGFFLIVLSTILTVWTFKHYRNKAALRGKYSIFRKNVY